MFVPVTNQTGKKLMPTRANKAGMLIKKGLATPYWSNGIFCIRLNYAPEDAYTQDIVVGVDPGSKKEGVTEGKRLTTGTKRNDFRVLTRLNFNYRSGHSFPS